MSNFTDFVGGGGESFEGVDLSSAGATHTMDLSQGNYFIGGELTDNTLLAFTNVPQSAKWSYTAIPKKAAGYSILEATYDNITLNVASQDTAPTGLFFKPDGTKMYVVGSSSDRVHQYSLSTAWDISTASFDNLSFVVSGVDTTPKDIFFKADGTKMYIVGDDGDKVYQYSLSTGWDLTTASYDGSSFRVHEADNPSGVFFKTDGTKMYVVDTGSNSAYQYSLSTAWDISTASYDSVNVSFLGLSAIPTGISFKPDGTAMYVIFRQDNRVLQHDLSTAWDLSTASYNNLSFTVGFQDSNPTALFSKPDGFKMYVIGDGNNAIFQYTTVGTTTITLPSSVQDLDGGILTTISENIRITYEFATADGGTNVALLSQKYNTGSTQ